MFTPLEASHLRPLLLATKYQRPLPARLSHLPPAPRPLLLRRSQATPSTLSHRSQVILSTQPHPHRSQATLNIRPRRNQATLNTQHHRSQAILITLHRRAQHQDIPLPLQVPQCLRVTLLLRAPLATHFTLPAAKCLTELDTHPLHLLVTPPSPLQALRSILSIRHPVSFRMERATPLSLLLTARATRQLCLRLRRLRI